MMKPGTRNCFIGLILLLSFISCTNDLEKVQMEMEGDEVPSVITKEVKVIYSDSGVTKFELFAPERLDYKGNNAPYSVMPAGVRIKFYEKDGRTTMLKADYAILKDKEGILIAQGNVKITNKDGEEMLTNQLTWDDQSQVIYTDERISVISKEQVLQGEGLWANQDFSRYRILIPEGAVNVKED